VLVVDVVAGLFMKKNWVAVIYLLFCVGGPVVIFFLLSTIVLFITVGLW
jgi:hypothetical protein